MEETVQKWWWNKSKIWKKDKKKWRYLSPASKLHKKCKMNSPSEVNLYQMGICIWGKK